MRRCWARADQAANPDRRFFRVDSRRHHPVIDMLAWAHRRHRFLGAEVSDRRCCLHRHVTN
eukprot:366311-Chlamydomonas_euryale.AAC.20